MLSGLVFGIVLGRKMNSLVFGIQMALVAIGATLLGPIILVAISRTPEAFTALVVIANILFWGYIFWLARTPRART